MLGTSTAQNAVIPYQMLFGLDGTSPLASLPLGGTITAAKAGVGGSAYALKLKLTEGVPNGKNRRHLFGHNHAYHYAAIEGRSANMNALLQGRSSPVYPGQHECNAATSR